ncbi:MAG: ribose 5-phosphate isomerase B [Alphaproteobacteria bacterium]|nr:ribose 5-phosphate isomerase B [Alphaproteobacteria bacterium]
MTLKVAIACDHGGVDLKNFLKDSFELKWIDLGTNDPKKSVDYPDYGYALAETIASGEADFGIAICGSGIGISIACNRHPDIRAALCTNTTMAKLAREHNDANVLCLGARLTGEVLAAEIVKEFLENDFEGGRHQARIDKLTEGL